MTGAATAHYSYPCSFRYLCHIATGPATFMSQATVRVHLNRINIKLDTSNRVHIPVAVDSRGASGPTELAQVRPAN